MEEYIEGSNKKGKSTRYDPSPLPLCPYPRWTNGIFPTVASMALSFTHFQWSIGLVLNTGDTKKSEWTLLLRDTQHCKGKSLSNLNTILSWYLKNITKVLQEHREINTYSAWQEKFSREDEMNHWVTSLKRKKKIFPNIENGEEDSISPHKRNEPCRVRRAGAHKEAIGS